MGRPSFRHRMIVGLRTACVAKAKKSAFRADEAKMQLTLVEQRQARLDAIERRVDDLSAKRTAVNANFDALTDAAASLSRQEFEERLTPILRERAALDRQLAEITWEIAATKKWMKDNGLMEADPTSEENATAPMQA
jgi:hypothetical protein